MDEKVVARIGTEKTEAETEMTRAVSVVEKDASAIVIKSQADYEAAAEFGRNIKAQAAKVTEFFAPMKKAAHDAHKNICDREKEMLAPLAAAEKTLKKTMSDYIAEVERARRAEEERLRRIAQAEAEKRMQEAIAAAENGNEAGAEEAFEDAQAAEQAATMVTLEANKPKADGVAYKTDYEIVGIDASKVPVSVAGIEIRPVDTAAVMRLIRMSKGNIKIDGVEFKEVKTMIIRK